MFRSRQLTPEEIEIRVPRYFRREREKEIENNRKFIEKVLKNLGVFEEKPEVKKMTELEAIRLIQVIHQARNSLCLDSRNPNFFYNFRSLQSHERARQGRVRFQFMKEILQMKERSTIRSEAKEPDSLTSIAAALKIQKVWRGYAVRRRIRQRKLDEMLLIGKKVLVLVKQAIEMLFRFRNGAALPDDLGAREKSEQN